MVGQFLWPFIAWFYKLHTTYLKVGSIFVVPLNSKHLCPLKWVNKRQYLFFVSTVSTQLFNDIDCVQVNCTLYKPLMALSTLSDEASSLRRPQKANNYILTPWKIHLGINLCWPSRRYESRSCTNGFLYSLCCKNGEEKHRDETCGLVSSALRGRCRYWACVLHINISQALQRQLQVPPAAVTPRTDVIRPYLYGYKSSVLRRSVHWYLSWHLSKRDARDDPALTVCIPEFSVTTSVQICHAIVQSRRIAKRRIFGTILLEFIYSEYHRNYRMDKFY